MIVKELLAPDEQVNCVGLEVDIDTELAVASHTGFFSHHFVDRVHQINGTTKPSYPLRPSSVLLGARGSRHQKLFGWIDGRCRKPVGDKFAASCRVEPSDVVVNQSLLLSPQRSIGRAELGCCVLWLLGRGRFLLIRLGLSNNQSHCDKKTEND